MNMRMMTITKSDGTELGIRPCDIMSVDTQQGHTWIKLKNGENYQIKVSASELIANINYSSDNLGIPE